MNHSNQDNVDDPRFVIMLQNLNRGSIPSLASKVRHSGHPSTGIFENPTTQPIDCKLLSTISRGSFNAVFKIEFTDRKRWVLKVPANGHPERWDAAASEALTSEAFTMRLIKRQTTIPVPEVFAFDASCENELGCPFILMECVQGKPLHEVWWDQSISHARREQLRIRSLHDIAEAMTQLNTLNFSQGGSLRFDTKGNVSGVGSSNVVDFETQHANMESPDFDHTMAFCQVGPFNDAKTHLFSWLDTYEGKSELSPVSQGSRKLLRLFTEWSIMRLESDRKKPFVLAHADLDSQNIFVDDEGNLTGIIDFDGIAAVPICVGPQSLPKFLTEDYNPDHYDYDEEAGKPKAGHLADSPEELASYRAMYAQFMESYLSDNDRMAIAKGPRQARVVRMSRKQAADATRRSLVTNTLQLAAKAPSQMTELMEHLFEEIEKVIAAKYSNTSSTAIQKAPSVNEKHVNGGGDTGAIVEKNTVGTEEKSSGESPEPEGTAINIEGLSVDELMDKIDQFTSTYEVKNTSGAEETSCVDSPGSQDAAINVEDLSIDELMAKIEQLTGRVSASDSKSDITQGPADLQHAFTAEVMIPEPADETHTLSATSDKKIARVPRAARVCGWFQKKLRGGANRLHKQPKKDDTTTRTDSTGIARPIRATRVFCGWTETKLRRVACCLHSDNGDNTDKARIEAMIEAVQSGAIDVLKGLQARLKQLIQTLHRKESNSSVPSENSEAKASRNQKVTNAIKELTKAEKRSVCAKFVHMVQDKQLHLSADQQVAIAHGIIQMLRDPVLSDSSLGTADSCPRQESECREGDVNGGHDDSENDSVCQESGEDRNGIDAHGEDRREGAKETRQEDEGEDSLEPRDRACTDIAGTESDQEIDTGAFNLSDICIALSKGDLDKRRMRRLQEGFLGLLNQSM